jgi:hypothetical protein
VFHRYGFAPADTLLLSSVRTIRPKNVSSIARQLYQYPLITARYQAYLFADTTPLFFNTTQAVILAFKHPSSAQVVLFRYFDSKNH